MHSPARDEIVLHDAHEGRWLHFRKPLHLYSTTQSGDILPLLRTVEQRVEAEGLWAAGFLAYEAAPAFDAALRVRPPAPDFPLLWFGLYPEPVTVELEPASVPALPALPWKPTVTPERYEAAIAAIKEQIAGGYT